MCACGVSNYSGYGRLSSISEKYIVCSPWFDTENDKDGLQKGLAELGAWYVEHLPEINFSYEKQQTWLDKDYRDAKITRAYLDEHLSELTEPEIFELYRTIDRLAGEYEKSDMKNRKNSSAAWRKPGEPDTQPSFKKWFLPYALRMWILPAMS